MGLGLDLRRFNTGEFSVRRINLQFAKTKALTWSEQANSPSGEKYWKRKNGEIDRGFQKT
jgi:hypothetical protein